MANSSWKACLSESASNQVGLDLWSGACGLCYDGPDPRIDSEATMAWTLATVTPGWSCMHVSWLLSHLILHSHLLLLNKIMTLILNVPALQLL